MADAPARTMSVAEARTLAREAHGDQRDRDGSLHVAHVERVVDGLGASGPAQQRVAWLHDVLEDTDLDEADLRAGGLPHAELQAVLLLTHDATELSYDEYIDRLVAAGGEAGRLARAVKEADMLDNLRRCVLARDPALEQYGRSLAKLWRLSAAP